MPTTINTNHVASVTISEEHLNTWYRVQPEVKYSSNLFSFMLGRIGKVKKKSGIYNRLNLVGRMSNSPKESDYISEESLTSKELTLRDGKVWYWPSLTVKMASGDDYTMSVPPDRRTELDEMKAKLMTPNSSIEVG